MEAGVLESRSHGLRNSSLEQPSFGLFLLALLLSILYRYSPTDTAITADVQANIASIAIIPVIIDLMSLARPAPYYFCCSKDSYHEYYHASHVFVHVLVAIPSICSST